LFEGLFGAECDDDDDDEGCDLRLKDFGSAELTACKKKFLTSCIQSADSLTFQ